ncbi:MAG: hypothetical protein ACK4NR_09190 [Micavibrio sp.]
MTNTAATFAYRLTAEGAEKVEKAFSGVNKSAKGNFNEAAKNTRVLNNDLRDLVNRLKDVEGTARGLSRLRNAVLSLAGAGGIAYLIKNSLEAAAHIGDMAAQAGVGVEEFQELEFALRKYNVEQDKVVDGLLELNKRATEFARDNAGPAKGAFERLGFSQSDVAEGLKNSDRFFETVLQKISELDSEAERLQLLDKIFGGGAGKSLAGAASAGIDAIRAAREEARQLNYVVGKDLVEASDVAAQRLDIMFDILKRQLVIAVAENADEIERFVNVMIDGLPRAIELLERVAKLLGIVELSPEEKLDKLNKRIAENQRVAGLYGSNPITSFGMGAIIEGRQKDTQEAMQERHELERQMLADYMARENARKRIEEERAKPRKGGSGGIAVGDVAAEAAAKRQAQAVKDLIRDLEFEIDVIKKSEREQAILRAERQLGAEATAEQKAQVRDLAGALFDEQEKIKKVKEEQEKARKKTEEWKKEVQELGREFASAFEEAIIGGKKLSEVLDGLLSYIQQILIRKTITEPLTEGLGEIFDGLDLGSIFGGVSGKKASGGTVYAGELYQVNERGRQVEGFRPATGGQIIPLGVQSGSNVSVTIINNTPSRVSQQQGQKSDGTPELRIQIDQEIANNINNPYSRTNQALRNFRDQPATRR